MATATNPNADDKTRSFAGFKVPNIDMNAIMDSYKKNMEILGVINKMSMEVCGGVAKLQSAFVKQVVNGFGGVIEKCTKPSEAFAKFSEVTRDSFVKALGNGKQISDMMTVAGNEITSAITKRMKEGRSGTRDSGGRT